MHRRFPLLFVCILPLQAQLTVNTIVGGAIRPDAPADNVQLNGASGITHDPAGNLVFCEHYVIRRLNADGTTHAIAGTGFSGFSGDGGLATQATLGGCASPRYDSKGNLYFADNGRIRRIDAKGMITTFAGTGINGTLGADGPLASAQLYYPISIAIAPDDSIYVGEYSDVRRITPSGAIEAVNTGSNPKCSVGYGATAQPCGPYALTFDSQGNLYFVESPGNAVAPSGSSFIRRISPGGAVAQVAGFGTGADGGPAVQATFYGISAIGFDGAGNLYVAQAMDTSHTPGFIMAGNTQNDSVIRRISASDGTVTTIAGAATAPTPLEGPAMQAYLGYVTGFAANSDGSIAFSSTHTIALLTTQSTIQLLAGRTFQPPPDGVKAAGGAWLSLPASAVMAASRSGNFFYADHCMIRKVDATGVLSTVAGTGNCASSVPKGFGPGIDLPPVDALAADSQDKIYARIGSNIYSLSAGGTISAINVNALLAALAVDSQDRLYIVPFYSDVFRVDTDGTVREMHWNYKLPSRVGVSPGFYSAISIDPSDNVYLLDAYALNSPYSHVLYRFTAAGVATNVAALASYSSSFSYAVDGLGGIWFYDGLDRFTHIEPAESNEPNVSMAQLCCGYSGDGGDEVAASFALVSGTTLTNDASGNIYVLDAGNAAIRKISGAPPAQAPVISAGGIVNAASFIGGAIAPGELISIFGSNFLSSGLQLNSPQDNIFPAAISNLRVSFSTGATSAYGAIAAATPNQINVFVPYEVAGSDSVTVNVLADYLSSAPVTLPLAASAFGLSTTDASGSGQGAILNQDGSYNSDSNPAAPGSIVSLFGTGEGVTTPALPDGALEISTPYSQPNASVTVTIGGQPANVTYAGAAPFLATGVLQINAQIPEGVSGDPMVLVSIGGISTSRKVTVAVK